MRPLICLIFFLLINLYCFSQKNTSIGIRGHYGFIIPHTESIRQVSHTRPYGFELSLGRLNTSYDSWKIFRKYNISGIQAGYFNYQNPDVVGSSYALSLFTEPVIRAGEEFYFSVRGGGGISWQTKIYDYELNPLNRFFSTRISFPLYISARISYRIARNTFITFAGTYNHISNGAIRVPNLGINFPTISAGIEYYPGSFPELDHGYIVAKSPREKNRYIQVQMLTGYKYIWGEPAWASGASIRHTWQLRNYYALNAGAELILDGGVRKRIYIDGLDMDYKRLAVTGGQDFILGRALFTQYIGIYIYSPYKARHPVYQKYELSFRFSGKAAAGVYLKAHTSDADLFGFTLNYIIKIS